MSTPCGVGPGCEETPSGLRTGRARGASGGRGLESAFTRMGVCVPERAGGWREPGEGTLSLSLAEHLLCPGPGPGLSQESAPPTLRAPCEVRGRASCTLQGTGGPPPRLPCVALMASPRTCTRDPSKRKQSRAGEGGRLGTFSFLF